jgi:hypothetical protein
MMTMRLPPLAASRTARLLPWFWVVLAAAPLFASDLPPVKEATTYPDVDLHGKEHVAIAAEPYDTKQKCKVFRVDYLKYNFLPIRIIVTNLGDEPISLRDARIEFISAAGDKIPAAEPEDVDRRAGAQYNRAASIPIGPIRIHPKGKNADSKVEADFDEFEYASIVVDPHSTRAGFLFYDMQGLGSTPLRQARLIFREVEDSSGHQLFYFEIPFDKYLAAPH